MANSDKPMGFRPARYLNGAPYNGAATRYYVTSGDATAIFVGDLVKLDGGSDGSGVRSVTRPSASQAVVGVVVGVEPTPTNLNTPQYRAASTAQYLYVADDPNILFEAQEDGNIGTAAVGLNANVTSLASGSTTTGTSGMEIDSSTTATTNTLPLKVVEAVQREDNDSTASNAKWLVKINSHQLVGDTGATGV